MVTRGCNPDKWSYNPIGTHLVFFQVANGTKDLLTLQHGIDWHRHFSPCHTVSASTMMGWWRTVFAPEKCTRFLVKFAVSLKKLHCHKPLPTGFYLFFLILPSSERVALLWVPKTSGESCKFHRFFGIPLTSFWSICSSMIRDTQTWIKYFEKQASSPSHMTSQPCENPAKTMYNM